jgi:ribosomal protein L11 methyltransferase
MILRITAAVPRRSEKTLTASLFAAGAMSVERSPCGKGVSLSALAGDAYGEAVESVLRPFDVRREVLEEKNWQNEWVSSFDGCSLASGMAVLPSGASSRGEGLEIFIDPRDAFGAGTHPTTRLCAVLVREAVERFHPSSFLDIGTGTGILAILAAKLGVSRVEGFDIDAAAVVRARENCVNNGCAGIVLFQSGIDGSDRSDADLVCANVNSAVLEQYFDGIVSSMSPGGALILSGIGSQWRTGMENLFSASSLSVVMQSEDDGWLGYLLQRQ